VLDSLGVKRATFAGHSFAGSELSWLGAFHADRVDGLIYLDAFYNYPRLYADTAWKHSFPVPQPPIPASPSRESLRRWFALVVEPDLTDDEIRAMSNGGSSTGLAESLQRGAAVVTLSRITPRALVVVASPRSVEDQYPYWRSLDPTSRARIQAAFAAQETIRASHLAEFRREVPHAEFVMIAGGRHYVFLSHPRQVAAAMNAFLASRR